MRTNLACMVVLGAALGAASCAVVNPDHRDEVLGRRDGGGPGGDGGGQEDGGGAPQFDDSCGASSPRMILRDTTRDIMIDTTSYTNRNRSSCGGETPGSDVFIAVDVVAGEYWHFHLQAVGDGRDPMLYLTQASNCGSLGGCEYVSSQCAGTSDEHFAFVAGADGRWFIGIDDAETGGGQYFLGAYRPVCGDNTDDHGEACDDGNVADGDGCDRRCRVELSDLRTTEMEENNNRVEANAIRLPASNTLDISGTIGGPGQCTYPDVFAISVPADGDLSVDGRQMDGSACTGGATTPFLLALENSRGETVQSRMTDGVGCAVIRGVDLPMGEYFVRVFVDAETAIAADYRLRFALTP
ncbi:MAG: hypothetical protein M5U28_45310 [Sandaracinaceae bacterium]|nr:hypothetical protein [Sandaracinaceae bacterium]